MLTAEQIKKYNEVVLQKMSLYLNLHADFIEASIIEELTSECGLTDEEAFAMVLAQVCGLDIETNEEDRNMYEYYFSKMITLLNQDVFTNNAYYKNIRIPEIKEKNWCFKQLSYSPYEAFVYNDLKKLSDGRLIPQIGFFKERFSYPAVLENRREWMLITPNEIETMKEVIYKAKGKVLTYGLGMGYYAYMVSEKEEVNQITIVEKDESVISLFKQYILPQFKYKEKVRIIHEDAFEYAKMSMAKEQYDFVFTDIWHDPIDGIPLYLKMKEYENLSPNSHYDYWIEATMKCYL